jgi:hypothetical protein
MTRPADPTPDSPEPRARRRLPRPEEPLFDTESFGDLSEAAREAVRQPADPRIDAHLAHLGLTDEPAPRRSTRAATTEPEPAPATPAVPDLSPEVERLRATVDALGATVAALERRARLLTWALVAVLLLAVAAVLLALR